MWRGDGGGGVVSLVQARGLILGYVDSDDWSLAEGQHDRQDNNKKTWTLFSLDFHS